MRIQGVSVCVMAVYAKLSVFAIVSGRIWWRRSRTELYVLIIIGGKEGVVVAGGGGSVGVAADPGTKFVVQTTKLKKNSCRGVQ